MRVMTHMDEINGSHHGGSAKQIRHDTDLVEYVKQVVTERIVDPFTATNVDLVKISTGIKNPLTTLITIQQQGSDVLKAATASGTENIISQTFTKKKPSKASKEKALISVYQETAVNRSLCFL